MKLYLINGFLGSGKTTAIAHACQQLSRQNVKTAVITNDQGEQQVDGAYLRGLSLANREVGNGCFCCRYDEWEEMVIALGRTEEPEIVFAESVGSCTDLVATVAKPFALRNDNVRVVISVFADACLMHSIMKGTSCFIEEAVQYIYRKQLEEADIIVINKTDLVTPDELEYVTGIIETTYPGKRIFYMNAFNEMDVRNWIQLLETFGIPSRRQSLNLDYDLYGAGEAALAWLDQKISLYTHKLVAISTALMLADNIYDRIMKAGRTIGHLKFLLSDDWWHKKISYTTNAVKEDHIDGDSHLCNHVDILINARVQTDPRELQQIVALAIEETMTETGCRIVTHKLSAFQPGYPRPLHRISTV